MTNTIRIERAILRISQQDLANAIGVSRQTIFAIENEKFDEGDIRDEPEHLLHNQHQRVGKEQHHTVGDEMLVHTVIQLFRQNLNYLSFLPKTEKCT